MMNNKIILLGGGGHCQSVIDVAEGAGYEILGILDPNLPAGTYICGYKVLGNDDLIKGFVGAASFVITVGQIKNSDIRRRLAQNICELGGCFATIIATDAYVSKYASIGQGTVVMHRAFVNAGVKIGNNCIINTMTDIEHGVVIGDFCHISTGSIINGDCSICSNVFIGSRSVLGNGLSVCDNCIIGAGSIILKDVVSSGFYIGMVK